ncbi:hypothetical protein ARMSODRAFT_976748 [Armillaria solidipes]|uniref:Uncharacterized protein n=1 Tax=Armillaria solidipes TaxID=1076256 RepID=A0A2H3B9I5_9AGAR|nr:hypothetical protein ARMSODRAFT_976748 [Armillaria solidipes]
MCSILYHLERTSGRDEFGNDSNPTNGFAVLPDIRDYIWRQRIHIAWQRLSNSEFTRHRMAFATHLDNVTVMRFTANASPAVSFNTPFVTPMDNPSYNDRPWTAMYTSPASIHYNATAISSVSRTVACVGVKPSNSTGSTSADQIQRCIGRLATKVGSSLPATSWKSCKKLLETHVADHSSLFDRFYRGRTDNFARNAISTTYLLTDQGRFLPSGLDGDQGLFALKTEHSNLQGIGNSELSSNWGCATPAVISEMLLKEFANIARKYTLKINQEE